MFKTQILILLVLQTNQFSVIFTNHVYWQNKTPDITVSISTNKSTVIQLLAPKHEINKTLIEVRIDLFKDEKIDTIDCVTLMTKLYSFEQSLRYNISIPNKYLFLHGQIYQIKPDGNYGPKLRFNGNYNNVSDPIKPTTGYDFRTEHACGKNITILDQGQCGSCYTMSATQMARHRYCMINGVNSVNGTFSPQYTLSCNSDSFDCDGGWPFKVTEWMSKYGVSNICCAPYNQKNGGDIHGTCPSKNNCMISINKSATQDENKTVVNKSIISQYAGCKLPPMKQQPSNQTTLYQPFQPYEVGTHFSDNITKRCWHIMNEIKKNGPVTMAYAVFYSFYYLTYQYPKDVQTEKFIEWYKNKNQDYDKYAGGHAVVIVGYEQINGSQNQIVQNSWGKDWGDNGQFRIEACKDVAQCESWSLSGMYHREHIAKDYSNLTCNTVELINITEIHGHFPGEKINCNINKSHHQMHKAVNFLQKSFNMSTKMKIVRAKCQIVNGILQYLNLSIVKNIMSQKDVKLQYIGTLQT